jgi:2,5-diamino-6-(ribosylamino)-4(3H)-pyrimidinone 5'-phosphate reductase
MRAALEALNRKHGVQVLRGDSGGRSNSVLLHAGLVSEVSVLIHPFIAGGKPVDQLRPTKSGYPGTAVAPPAAECRAGRRRGRLGPEY